MHTQQTAEMDTLNTLHFLTEQVHTLQMNQAFQEDSIEALEKTIVQQHLDIQHLKNQMSLLSDYLKTIRQETGQGGLKNLEDETPPPHY